MMFRIAKKLGDALHNKDRISSRRAHLNRWMTYKCEASHLLSLARTK